MPAKAGIQNYLKTQDSSLRGIDVKGRFRTFYETVKIDMAAKKSTKNNFRTKILIFWRRRATQWKAW